VGGQGRTRHSICHRLGKAKCWTDLKKDLIKHREKREGAVKGSVQTGAKKKPPLPEVGSVNSHRALEYALSATKRDIWKKVEEKIKPQGQRGYLSGWEREKRVPGGQTWRPTGGEFRWARWIDVTS